MTRSTATHLVMLDPHWVASSREVETAANLVNDRVGRSGLRARREFARGVASLAPMPAWMASPAAGVCRPAARLSSAAARYSCAFLRKFLAWFMCSVETIT
jgi:hypothetical protein